MVNIRSQPEKDPYETRGGRLYSIKIKEALESGDVQAIIDNLSIKQRRFCEEYILDFNGGEAINRAGYKTNHASKMAYELLKKPAIKLVIDALTETKASKAAIHPGYVIKKITRTIEKAEMDNNHTAVLRGCELLARHLGMFIERTEISGPDGEAIKYERVQEAADAFSSAIASLVERAGEDEPIIVVGPKC